MNDSRSFYHPRIFRVVGFSLLLLASPGAGADWPTYRHDNQRSAVTGERLEFPLVEHWRFVARHAPEPAWEKPRSEPVEGIVELGRTQFDDAHHAVVAGGAVYFGAGVEEKVYCLDLGSGAIRWTRRAGGAVRLAPAAAGGRVYFGADDGVVRCVDAARGATVWERRVGPGADRMLGHGRMISRWPVRTGVLVEGDRVYFGAGIWPAEGVYMEAARAADGRTLWRNDTCGEDPRSIMSPQGYMLTAAHSLFVPHGRVSPGAFDIVTGKYRGTTGFGKTVGGTNATVCDGVLYTGTEEIMAYRPGTKGGAAWMAGRQIVITPEVSYLATDSELLALAEEQYARPSLEVFGSRALEAKAKREVATLNKSMAGLLKRRGAGAPGTDDELAVLREKIKEARTSIESIVSNRSAANRRAQSAVLWRAPVQCPESLVLAGDTLVGGGEGRVIAADRASGQVRWSAQVDGRARGLTVADGRLLVSTSTGRIHCFAPGNAERVATVSPPVDPDAIARDAPGAGAARAAAQWILRESGIAKGYCLVLGCESGRLALELARASALTIYAVEPDPAKAAAARDLWETAGLDGTRISVEVGPLDQLTHSDWYANLVVSERALHGSLDGIVPGEILRVLKPHGGTLALGQAAGNTPAAPRSLAADDLARWKGAASGLADARLTSGTGGTWLLWRRGALEGAGSWTHLYANAANTACGDDQLVGAPLSLLWYGRPGPLHMISRHRRAASPLTAGGVLFVQGEHLVRGYDAYNGLQLWERSFPNVVRDFVSHDCSNLACDGTSLFVAHALACERLDAGSGRTLGEYRVPGDAAEGERWGYVAVSDGRLFGSRGSMVKGGRGLFAYDVETARLLWERPSGNIPHPSISIAEGRVYLVEDPPAAASIGAQIEGLRPVAAERLLRPEATRRRVVCLDAATGSALWERDVDLAGGIGGQYWSSLGSMVSRGVLILFGVYTDGHYWKEFFAGQFESRRVVALDAGDGRPLWDRKIAYRVRPFILGDTLHAEPRAYDLRTGEPRTRTNPITGVDEPWQFARPGHHCGLPVAAPHLMLFRSAHIGYYDIEGDGGTMHFGSQRPGCWINFIPGNGLVLVPEASSGCMCPFPNMCTVVFKRGAKNRAWAMLSLAGGTTPARRLALNLGAPGDRKDARGLPWIGLPRPTGSLVLALPAEVEGVKGDRGAGAGEYFRMGADFMRVDGTDTPWLYTSGYKGLRRLSIPLLTPGDGVAEYAVRLHFAAPPGEPEGRRVFDVNLQGKSVERRFDPVAAAGGAGRALVREYRGVRVDGKLEIAFAPAGRAATADNGPILCAVDVERERVVSLGLTLPALTLNRVESSAHVEVGIGNLGDEPATGTLALVPPDGFAVEPRETRVEVPAGGRLEHGFDVRLTHADIAPGEHPLLARFTAPDGATRCERSAPLEFLGDRGRVRIVASEDTNVVASAPVVGREGSALVLRVDGGNAKMGDSAHSIAYLRFPLAAARARGRPVSATLTITNAGNRSSNGGDVCLVEGRWAERSLAYGRRPAPGRVLAHLGPVEANQVLVVPLEIDLAQREELSVAIVPVNTDGVDYLARESGSPPQLAVDYELTPR